VPKVRGKINGLLQLTCHWATWLVGAFHNVAVSMGMEKYLLCHEADGILLSLISSYSKGIPRGRASPEMQELTDLPELRKFHFEWSKVKDNLKNQACNSCICKDSLVFAHGTPSSAFILIYLGQERG
jgi:hypothetical protein